MDQADRAAALLRETESKLRDMLSAAASAGRYSEVVRIAAWAGAINEMLDGRAKAFRLGSTREAEPQYGNTVLTQSPLKKRTGRASDYPRFRRDGDKLVRVAWSKGEKKEYEHRTSHAVLQAVASVMKEKGVDGRIFSTEQLFPISTADGAEVPSYQAYVAIALLKHAGLLDQHGRRGYSIPRFDEFAKNVEEVWRHLPNV